MRNPILSITMLLLTLNSYGQNTGIHYIKFWHVGEQLLPVHTLSISYQDSIIPINKDEAVLDSLPKISVVTDEGSFKIISGYIGKNNFRLAGDPGVLSFGTFKIIIDGKYYYLPGLSCTAYFKNMVHDLKKRKGDQQVIQAIIDNYPWIFNP
ncbi:MAG: hypothetical protein ACHQIM_10090 [Sphingobacteriales bacterium]